MVTRSGSPGLSGRTFGVDISEDDLGEDVSDRRDGQFSTVQWTCWVSHVYLTRIRKEFWLPENIVLSVPEEHERACCTPPENVALNVAILRVIGRLPMHSLISQFVADLGCAPTQLVPNIY